MIIDEDVYIEHFGVMGMKWGVRNDKKNSKEGTSKKQKAKKIAAITALGAVIAAGTIYAIKKQKVRHLSSVPRFKTHSNNGYKAANKILKNNLELKARAISASRAAMVGSKEHNKTIRRVATDHLRSVNEANVDLKTWYNKSNIPIPERNYLNIDYWEKLAGPKQARLLSETTFRG